MTRPSLRRMLLRAVRRRCPWCGGRGAFFTGWFDKQEHCATCGLRWRRGDGGFELGAAGIAIALTLAPLIAVMTTLLALTWPSPPVLVLVLVLAVVALGLALLTYPLSYTFWQAIDLAMRPVTADDFDAGHIVEAALRDR